MHHQIKKVCAGLQHHVNPKGVSFDLSAGEQTPLGRILNLMYYRTGVVDLLPRDSHFGYPHNGGMHTFHYTGPKGDAVAFLELLKEELDQPKYRLNEEERQVLRELSFISQDILSRR
jgi:hypothetical protein